MKGEKFLVLDFYMQMVVATVGVGRACWRVSSIHETEQAGEGEKERSVRWYSDHLLCASLFSLGASGTSSSTQCIGPLP